MPGPIIFIIIVALIGLILGLIALKKLKKPIQ